MAPCNRSYYDERKQQFDLQLRADDAQIAQTNATISKYRDDEARYADRGEDRQRY